MGIDGATWQVTRVSVAGNSHVARGAPCQDASWHEVSGDLCVIAVADGVGSAPHSAEGALTAVEAAARFLIEKRNGSADEAEWLAQMQEAGSRALQAVRDLAQREKQELRAFASTLLLAAATNECTAAFQIGDGAIVSLFGTSELMALTLPKKGEFVNEVLPLTSKNALGQAQFIFVPRRATGLAVFTDGLESLALALPRGEPSTKFFLPIFNLATRVDDDQLADEIRELFEQRIKKRSNDDLTLAIAIRTDMEDKTEAERQSSRLKPLVNECQKSYVAATSKERPRTDAGPLASAPSTKAAESASLPSYQDKSQTSAKTVSSPPPAATAAPTRGIRLSALIVVLGSVLVLAATAVVLTQSRQWICDSVSAGSMRQTMPVSAVVRAEAPACSAPATSAHRLAGALEACGRSVECEAWLSCVGDRCIQKGGIDEPCEMKDECENGLDCRYKICLTPKGTLPLTKCKGKADCKGDLCVYGLCREARFGVGRVCHQAQDCAEPLHCIHERCRPKNRP